LLHDIDENYQLIDEINGHSKNNRSCEWLGRRRNRMRVTATRRRNIIAFRSDVFEVIQPWFAFVDIELLSSRSV